MANKKSAFDEIEKMLQDIGSKIEVLIEKGAEATGEARDEFEKKIQDLKKNRDKLEKELNDKRSHFEKKYKNKQKDVAPKLQESLKHFKDGFTSLIEAINNLFK